ncbi:MAG: alkyl sulfatase dimerization domain-containing protein [Acidimicrobiales bacterium]
MDGQEMLERSARWITGEEPLAMNGLFSENAGGAAVVTDGVAFIEAFSNVVAFETEEGIVLFDVSHHLSAPKVISELRTWSKAPVHTAVYTHGHVDHVTGAQAFDAEATTRGDQAICYVGHEAISDRFDRYQLTNGYNGWINMRQFRLPEPAWPSEFIYPDLTYRTETSLSVGGTQFDLRHARGETDDHTWAWIADHRAICVGDLFIWQFPNAGNPQKVQRFASDWAVSLRAMAAMQPELLLPAHGPAVGGSDMIAEVLLNTAAALESLHEQTLRLMNAGARLDEVIHSVKLPQQLADLPYLRPTYDEPEFVVRNLWRLYGGWYDGNPAHLKPAPEIDLARETAALAGGAEVLAARAESLASEGDHRLACHFAEMAVMANPDSVRCHQVRAAVYEARRKLEASYMAQGIYRSAAIDSNERLADL